MNTIRKCLNKNTRITIYEAKINYYKIILNNEWIQSPIDLSMLLTGPVRPS
jgi:hypothetical protein